MYREYDHAVHPHLTQLLAPSVESLAGDPESPKALAVPTRAIRAIVLKPSEHQVE